MALQPTPHRIDEILFRHAGIATRETPTVLAFDTPPFWHHLLFDPFVALRFRRRLLALEGDGLVVLELTIRLEVERLRRIPFAEIETVVAQRGLAGTVLILRLQGGEKLRLRVADRASGHPPQKSNLEAIVKALEQRGLLQKSTAHLKMLAAGLAFGLLLLGVLPWAVRHWVRSQTEREREAIRAYLEASRTPRPEPREYAPADVLLKIETYRAPPLPETPLSRLLGGGETYDARVRSGKPVPPTFSDTLVEDVKILLRHFFADSSADVGETQVSRALGLYLHVPWTSLPGYRPWTHSNFVKSLSEPERNTLARQIADRLEGWNPRVNGA